MKLINPFGPKIAVLKIPKNLIKKINNEFEQILLSKKLVKKRDYSKKLVGQVSQEIELSNKFIEKNLKKYIKKSINQYLLKSINKKTDKIKIKNLWIVRQLKMTITLSIFIMVIFRGLDI